MDILGRRGCFLSVLLVGDSFFEVVIFVSCYSKALAGVLANQWRWVCLLNIGFTERC